jgi:hypothetical protein
MLIRPRVMTVSAAVCVLTAMTLTSTALAHPGSEHFRRHDVLRAKQAQGVCAQAGVPLNGEVHGSNGHASGDLQGSNGHASGEVHGFNGHASGGAHHPSSLSETQTTELKAPCEKLATAYGVERKADEASSKVLWEGLEAARTKLDEACPALMERHEQGFWGHTELGPVCEEALKSYWTTAREAGKAYRTALQEAGKTFDTALGEFEEGAKSVLTALEAVQTEHDSHPGQGFGHSGSHEDGHR